MSAHSLPWVRLRSKRTRGDWLLNFDEPFWYEQKVRIFTHTYHGYVEVPNRVRSGLLFVLLRLIPKLQPLAWLRLAALGVIFNYFTLVFIDMTVVVLEFDTGLLR